MKQIIFMLIIVLSCRLADAQYLYAKTNGVTSPYYPANLNLGPSSILLGNSTTKTDQKLSVWQSLPFPFKFYGKSVNGYYASDNGYITFDTNATSSISKNVSIPSASAPSNSIFAFWQDLVIPANITGSGSNYAFAVRSWTYGTSPNRVHVVQWFGASNKSVSVSNYSYVILFSIRLYECGDFDIVHDYKGSSAGTFAATVGCVSPNGKLATEVPTSPKIDFPSVTATAAGSVVYTFIDSSNKYDLSLNSIDSLKPVYKSGDKIYFRGTVQNMGSDTLNSFAMYYQVDANPRQKYTFSSISIYPVSTYSFTFGTAYTAVPGAHTVKLWVGDSSLNGSGVDAHMCNNSKSLNFVVPAGKNKLKPITVMEYFMGAWGGYDPNGDANADSILKIYPSAPLVAIHGPLAYGAVNDKMMVAAADPIVSVFSGGFPSATFNRTLFNTGSSFAFGLSTGLLTYDWVKDYKIAESQAYAPVDVTISPSYNSTSKTLDATVSAYFEDYAQKGDKRITLYLVEDSLKGSGAGWDQHNYMYKTTGSPFYLKGTVDPANSSFSWIKGYVHRHVLRAIVSNYTASNSGTWGDSGIIPDIAVPGKTYSIKYSGIDVSPYNINHLSLIAFVNYFDSLNVVNRVVLNASNPMRATATGGGVAAPTVKDTSFCNPPKTIKLYGSGSRSGRYRWYSQASGGSAIDTNSSYSAIFKAGPDTIYVSAISGITESKRQAVIVTGYMLPDASFKWKDANANVVNFIPSDSTLNTYNWVFGDGTKSSLTKPAHTYISSSKYYVSLNVTDGNGCTNSFSDSVQSVTTSVAASLREKLHFTVSPNPYAEHSLIEYNLPVAKAVKITLIAADGRIIATLVDQEQQAGRHQYSLPAGAELQEGVYFIQTMFDNELITTKLVKTNY